MHIYTDVYIYIYTWTNLIEKTFVPNSVELHYLLNELKEHSFFRLECFWTESACAYATCITTEPGPPQSFDHDMQMP